MANKMNTAAFIGGFVLSSVWLFTIYPFFNSTAMAAKLLAAGAFVLLLILLIPLWIQLSKNFRSNQTMR